MFQAQHFSFLLRLTQFQLLRVLREQRMLLKYRQFQYYVSLYATSGLVLLRVDKRPKDKTPLTVVGY